MPPALATLTAEAATGSAVIPTTVLALSSEVIRTMTLLKIKFLGAVVLSVSVAGGFGVVALRADEKPIPATQPEKIGEKPNSKPGEKPTRPERTEKPKPEQPDEEKPKTEKP